MAINSFTSNQGTQSALLTDNTGGVGGTLIPVMKISTDGQGTFTNGGIWSGNVGVSSGTVNVSTISSLPNLPGGTLTNLITGTINSATVTGNIGVSSGTINVSTISTLPNVPGGTLTNLISGTINAATAILNNGTINLASVQMTSGTLNVATISTLPNTPGGTINLATVQMSSGTLNVGTINLGTIVGKDANAAAQTGNPIGIGGTDSGGTIRTILVNASGNINVGTITTLPNTPGGTVNLATVQMSSGTLNVATISTLPNIPGGSIVVTAGTQTTGTVNTGTVNTGTINVATVTAGSIVITAGTQSTGTVNTGTINTGTINAGTFVMTAGTITSGTVNAQGTIKDLYAAIGTMTITLGTLASSAAGVGRQSTLIDNTANLYQSAQVGVQITAGTSTGTNNIWIYLIRSDNGGGPIADDKAGTGDAGWTQLNAPVLGIMSVGAGTNVQYQNVYDTGPYRLGPKWGVGVVHNLGNPLNATAGSHSITYQGIQGKIA